MVIILINTINIIVNLIFWLILINWILQYFLSPYHPVRELLNRLVNPMLDPIRRVLPPTGMLDFSPLVLLILVQLLGRLLISLIISIY
jgi:YggT family protein